VPVADLPNVPRHADLFLDANIFIYSFLRKSAQCMNMIERCAREDVFGITSLDVVNDVTHRMMLAEACHKGHISKQNASSLKNKPSVIAGLTDYWHYAARIFSLNILLLDADEALLRAGQTVRSGIGLLTKDSLIVAAMDEYAIGNLATRDADFDRVNHIMVYRPTDI
jgi:predicted nucleic acid-binding protein